MKIRLILCDLGNVLINFDHRIAVRRILPFTDKNFNEVYQLFFDSKLTKDYEEGRISSQAFFRRLRRKLRLRSLSYRKFCAIWNEIFYANQAMRKVLVELKKKYRLHLISNINELHYRYCLRKFPAHLKVFDRIFLSYKVGHRKPHVKIYRKAIEKLGISPGEVLYTDDRADLIREARAIGFKTVLFKNAEDFKNRLIKLGILP